MTDKIDDLANELFSLTQEIKLLESKAKIIKDSVQKYFEKSELVKYTSDDYIIELIHRPEYATPTPTELREVMGPEFARLYISEVVDKKIRNDLPPALQNQLCPLTKDSSHIRVTPRKE